MKLSERLARLERAVAEGADARRDMDVIRTQLARAQAKALSAGKASGSPRKLDAEAA